MRFLEELKRRQVFRAGTAYLAVAWLLLQVTTTLVPALHLPDWVTTVVVFFLIICFPLLLVLAWAYELAPEGLKRESGTAVTRASRRNIDYLIIGALVLAVAYFSIDKFLLAPERGSSLRDDSPQAVEGEAAAAVADAKSIAVLPFDNMSADPEQAYFADGLAEELLNLLASVPELRVAARTSSFSFKGQNLDVQTIAGKLNVRHILEGSVRKAGDTLRVTAQLIDADSGYHLWSQRFDRKFEDVFAIQDEIAAAVVAALKLSLLDGPPTAEAINPQAYALYLQGVHFGDRWTPEGLEKSVEALQGALRLEPEYARAWAALGEAYSTQASLAYRDTAEGTTLALAAVDRALELDDALAGAHAVKAWIQSNNEWDWQGAEASVKRALALDPESGYSLNVASTVAAVLGRFEEALALGDRATELSPVDRALHFNQGWNFVAAGRLEEAAAAFRHVLELDPESPQAHASLGQVLLFQGQPEKALAEMEREPDPLIRELGTVLALSALGRTAEADRALADFVEKHGESAPYSVAEAYAWRGDADEAFRWLDKAYEQRVGDLAFILPDELLASLRSDPRWPAFLDRMGLPH